MENKYLSNKEKYLLTVATVLLVIAFLSITGCAGPRGDLGPQGIPGYSPVVGTQPATSQECLSGGMEVYVGSSKTVICNGSKGATGLQGNPGQDSDQVTIFKFCPNVTGNYPSIFPEYGIRLDSKVYAVYSSNGGFLTLLTPGTYKTTGIGSNCNFTVNSDGSLSY
jgi:hypothetical protein